MIKLNLTQNKYALVNESTFEWLNQWKWCYDQSNGYAHRNAWIGGRAKKVYMHRLILSAPSGLQVDHINRNKLDNRIENLRICTASENALNKTLPPSPHGQRGVYPLANGWRAQIKRNGVLKHLGWFKDYDRAVKARIIAEGEYV